MTAFKNVLDATGTSHELQRFAHSLIGPVNGKRTFTIDFDKYCPAPKELLYRATELGDIGWALLCNKSLPIETVNQFVPSALLAEAEEAGTSVSGQSVVSDLIRSVLESRNHVQLVEALQIAKVYEFNVERWGYPTLDAWRRSNWGTPENAYDLSIASNCLAPSRVQRWLLNPLGLASPRIRLHFLTVESPALLACKGMAAAFPDIKMDLSNFQLSP